MWRKWIIEELPHSFALGIANPEISLGGQFPMYKNRLGNNEPMYCKYPELTSLYIVILCEQTNIASLLNAAKFWKKIRKTHNFQQVYLFWHSCSEAGVGSWQRFLQLKKKNHIKRRLFWAIYTSHLRIVISERRQISFFYPFQMILGVLFLLFSGKLKSFPDFFEIYKFRRF